MIKGRFLPFLFLIYFIHTLILLKMKVNCIRTYKSKSGNPTFVYTVNGSTEDLVAYKKAQGTYYREQEDGTPLWFTTRYIGEAGDLLITSNGNIVPDMSKLDKQASLVAQYGGNFGDVLAQQGLGKIKE
jgi:hypothetical protein